MFILLLLLFSNLSQAVYGDLLPLNTAPEHACLLNLGHGTICSATLIAPNALKTAAHCLRNRTDNSITVTCPNGQTSISKKLIIHPEYKTAVDKRQYDSGLIITQKNLKTNFTKVILSTKEIDSLLKSSPVCAVWAFGLNIEHPYQFGFYNGVAIKDHKKEGRLIVLPDATEVFVRDGDSGGGLFCIDSNNRWVNVASVYGHDYVESFLLRNDSVAKFVKDNIPLGAASNQKSQIQIPSKIAPSCPNCISSIQLGKTYSVRPFSKVSLPSRISSTGDQTKVTFTAQSKNGNWISGTLIVNDLAPGHYLCDESIICRGSYTHSKIHTSRLTSLK